MVCYITPAFSDIPALKVMCIVLNCICHVNGISLSCFSRIGAESHFLFTERDIIYIKICDPVAFEQHRIISDRLAFCYTLVKLSHGSISDI